MSIHTIATHVSDHDTDALLADAVAVMAHARVPELLGQVPGPIPAPNGADSPDGPADWDDLDDPDAPTDPHDSTDPDAPDDLRHPEGPDDLRHPEDLGDLPQPTAPKPVSTVSNATNPDDPDRAGVEVDQAPPGAYTVHGFLCAQYEMVASHRPFSLKELFDTLWVRYTPAQMAAIGLAHLRTPERLAAMARPVPKPGQPVTNADINRAVRANKAEYQRIWQEFQRAFAAMDDTPIVANHRGTDRPSRTEVARAAAHPDLIPKRQLKWAVLNAIIGASVHHENDRRHPGTPLHEGILANHHGHVAIDETHAVVGLGDLPKGAAPGNQIARVHAKSRQHKGMAPAVVGVTLGIAASRPDQAHANPDLCLAASIHHPTGGLGSAALTVMDAIDTNRLRAPRPSNRNQYVIVDGGYTEAVNLNRQLHARHYGMVMEYRKDRRVLFEVGAINHPDGERTPGIHIYNGRPLCPGESRKWLEKTKPRIPKDDDGNFLPGPELDAHAKLERRITAATMPTHGRPEEHANRPRGGQRKTHPGVPTPTPDNVMRVTVICPAIQGTARCRIFDDFADPALAHLPAIPAPPVDLPLDKRPACCSNDSGKMRVNIPLDVFKTWQDFMPGTWEHEDWYTAPRSANERYNNYLKRPHGGANLSRGAIAPRKAAPFALAIAMSVATTNRRVMESWDARVAAKGGVIPAPPAKANREARAAALNADGTATTGANRPTRGR
ncbi:hypothetical protein [Nocardioides sp.]|uniref:hypothetical protein n=1 Tax=Nocardioides sp. TaxID=35761 RepID=UPI0027214D4D|nr:hypothetical protein [Nocardioides sp.]MDO9455213.1 hypothetical protein [Nocardioides sp.]